MGVAPTISPRDLICWGSGAWRNYFPFSARYGRWTFSGRVALDAGLRSLKLAAGAAVLVPAYFQGTEIDTLLAAGHTLHFYRLDDSLQADLDDLEKASSAANVGAVYVIHYFGFPQPLPQLVDFAQRRNIPLIEDCALSLFSRDEHDWLGTRGEMALFSVYKTLPLPHGGYLVTKSARGEDTLAGPPLRSTCFQTFDLLVEYLRVSKLRGVETHVRGLTRRARRLAGWRREESIGAGRPFFDPRILKYRSSQVAPFLMRNVDPAEVIRKRRRNYLHLSSLLAERQEPLFPRLPPGVCPLFYPLLVDDKLEVQRSLAAKGVPSVNLWIDPHPACPEEYGRQASFWRRHILELPIHQDLEGEAIDFIGNVVRSLPQRCSFSSGGGGTR